MPQRLFLLSPTTVFAARVNEPSGVTYPVTSVEFDTVTTGAFGNVTAGLTVLFGSTAGADDSGRQRIRAVADANTIFIGRSSQGTRDGEINISDNDFITVLDDRRIWAKIPDIDGSGNILKDEEAYTDQTSNIPPKANIAGGAVAATIGGASTITVQFDGSGSYAVASGATISSYSWDVDDGTITMGSGTNTITATFPAGFRWVSLTVTDSNTKTHTQWVPVYARDAASDDSIAFQCIEHRITQQGQACSFRILEDIDIATYPDGTLAIFWDGEPASASDRTNVRFWGWHQSDNNTVQAEQTATLKDTVLNCVDVAGRLSTLPGFTQSVERQASPSSWLEMANLNMDLYVDYLFRWHSTAFDLASFAPTNTGSTYDMVIIGSDGENLFDQCARRVGALIPEYVLTCNRNGEIRAIVDPMLQETGSRTATSQVTIGDSKWTGVNWQRMRPPRIHWLWGETLIASPSSIAAKFSHAPGVAPGQGESEQTSGEKLAVSQTTLNQFTGHEYARLNARNGLVPVQIINDSDLIEPADMTWVTLSVPDTYTRRQLGFSSDRGLPIEIAVTYEYTNTGMITRSEMMWEQETSGTAAVTYDPPVGPPGPPWTPPPAPTPTPTTNPGLGFGTVYVMTGEVLGRTRAFSAAAPSYNAVYTASSQDLYDFIIDPYNILTTGYLMTSTGLKKSINLDGASTFDDVLTLSEMETDLGVSGTLGGFFQVKGCIASEDFFAFGLHDQVEGVYGNLYVYVTTDGGNTWNAYLVHSLGWGQARFSGAIEVSTKLSGTSEPVLLIASGTGGDYIYRSTDGGQNWTQLATSTPTDSFAMDLHYPYNDNASNNIVLMSSRNVNGALEGRAISTDGGTNWTVSNPTSGAPGVNGRFGRTPFQTFTQDRQQMYCFTGNGTTSPDFFYFSNDGGSTWTQKHDFGEAVNAAGGFPYNESQFYVVTNSGIHVTTNGGTTWIDKTGDWSFNFNFASHPFTGGNIGGVIVPVWIEE